MSGNPSFYDIRNEFYKDTNGAILTFDVTNRKTFENLIRWVHELHFESGEASSVSSPVIILCGNKVDKAPRAVSYYEVSEWAAIHQYPYVETSALSGHGVTETFNTLFESIINPDIYQTYIPNHVNFRQNLNHSTYQEMNSIHQNSTMNIPKSYSKLNYSFKQFNMSSSPSSTASFKSNKNEQSKTTHENLLEINRIINAKNNYERLGISMTANSSQRIWITWRTMMLMMTIRG
ncbi:unnamed protein product [Schistosoma spindalis]|nr:unnamed protein product [Schistosoma spindale]